MHMIENQGTNCDELLPLEAELAEGEPSERNTRECSQCVNRLSMLNKVASISTHAHASTSPRSVLSPPVFSMLVRCSRRCVCLSLEHSTPT